MAQTLRIATRRSPLALAQATWVQNLLEERCPGIRSELVQFETSGDKILDSSLALVGGKGLFVKEIEEALLANKADLAVHSLKDVPYELPQGLHLAAFPVAESCQDTLVFPHANMPKRLHAGPFGMLRSGARIGTASVRRISLLKHYRADLEIVSLRGNVGTRLRKLDQEELGLDALVLAAAGLRRLGLEDRIQAPLPIETFIPAVGQGVLAIETRAHEQGIKGILSKLNDPAVQTRVTAERAFTQRLRASCQVPVGVYAEILGAKIRIRGFIASLDGERFLEGEDWGEAGAAKALGISLAERLLQSGGEKILDELRA